MCFTMASCPLNVGREQGLGINQRENKLNLNHRFVGGGHGGFAAFFNAGVHIVMYLYYLLSACGPQVQKHLWWKRWALARST